MWGRSPEVAYAVTEVTEEKLPLQSSRSSSNDDHAAPVRVVVLAQRDPLERPDDDLVNDLDKLWARPQ